MLWVSDSENASLGDQVAASEWLRELSALSVVFSSTSTVTTQRPSGSLCAQGGSALEAGRGRGADCPCGRRRSDKPGAREPPPPGPREENGRGHRLNPITDQNR